MPLFLFIALTTLTIFLLLTVIELPWVQATRRRHGLFALLVAVVVLLAASASGWAIFRSFYPAYGLSFFVFSLSEKFIVSFVLGIAFGIASGVFLRSITQGSPYRTISLQEKALIGSIGALLILGIGGEHFLQDAGRRISKLSFGGAEIAFTGEKPQRARESSGPPPNLLTSSTVGAPSLPVDILHFLPGFITRDEEYILFISRMEKKRDPKATLIDDTDEFVSKLRDAGKLATAVIKPMGKCLATIFNQTGDSEFVRRTFYFLLEPLSHVDALEGYTVAKFQNETVVGINSVFRRLFEYTYHRVHNDKSVAMLSTQAQEDRRTLEENCSPATYLACAGDDWSKMQDVIEKGYGADGKKVIADGVKKLNLKECYDDTIRILSINDGLSEYLATFAADQAFLKRPYMHIVIATILAQSKLDATALVYLENWLNESQQWGRKNPKYASAARWLQVRTLTIMSTLLDNWIAREGPNASLVLRESHIERLKKSLLLADQLFNYRHELSKLRRDNSLERMESVAFSSSPDEVVVCPEKEINNLFTWYIFASTRLVDNQLQSPRYRTHHAPDVNKTIRDLLDIRFGCATRVDDPEYYPKLFRAETLRLYALMQLQDSVALKNVLAKGSLEAQLRSGLRAANLGLHVIKAIAETKINDKLLQGPDLQASAGQTPPAKASTPILERLAPVDLITSYERLDSVRSRLQDALDNLERD